MNDEKPMHWAMNEKEVFLNRLNQETQTVRRADILWLTLHDMIHHRGQFSIYLRMAGGKVPSIYGPSGDEPWM